MYKFTTFLSLPLILLLWISGNTLAAHTELAVAPSDTVFIPDANFKNGLLNLGIDLNNDGEIQYSEAESWTAQIKLPGEGIADITGIAAFTNVTDLRLHYNSLTTLDLRANPNLELVHVQHNNISTVYLSASSELSMLRIQNNALQELDLSQNRKLRYLETQNNQLQSLNVQNGNNTMMYKFNATGNPDLLCIQVDDVAYADANFSSGKDARAAFDLNCSSEPDIINFKPTLTASNTTDLPMPPTTADKSLKLITDTGYTGYRWYKNGSLIVENNSPEYQLNDIEGNQFQPEDTGSYTVVLVDSAGNGSQESDPIVVTYSEPAITSFTPTLSATGSTELPRPESEPDKTLELEADAGYPTYRWYKDGALVAENTSNLLMLNNAAGDQFQPSDAGDYTVVLLDSDGFQSNTSNTITVTYSGSEPSPDIVNIPDTNFKSSLIGLGVDTNGDGEIQYTEAEAWTQIKILSANIRDITGIEAFVNLTSLKIQGNALTTVDFSSNKQLYEAHLQNNPLTSVNFGVNQRLEKIRIMNTQITSLDLNGLSKLRHLEADNSTNLVTLKIRNGNNHQIYRLNLLGSNNLTCIEVDDVTYAEANLAANVPAGASFSLDCGGSSDPDISNLTPQLYASSSTNLPLPDSVADKSLELYADEGYNTYSFYKDGTLVQEGSDHTLILNNAAGDLFEPSDTGDYTVVVAYTPDNYSLASNAITVTYTESGSTDPDISNQVPNLYASGSTDLPVPDSQTNKELILHTSAEFNTYYWYKDGILIKQGPENTLMLNNAAGDLFEPSDAGDYTVVVAYSSNNQSLPSNTITVTYTATGEIVSIPDANFKAALIELGIDANTDGEIQYTEAESATGELRLLGKDIADLTGISAFINITDLRVHYNNLTSLDLSGNAKLKELHAQHNNLSSIVFSPVSSLSKMRLYNNSLTILDLRQLSGLRHLEAENNALTYLSVKNGNNQAMYLFKANNNPDLTCIEVDDVAYAEANFTAGKDATASFQASCDEVPEISTVKPTISASSSTDLPLPETTSVHTLILSVSEAYPTYRWYKDGGIVQEGTSDSLQLNNASGDMFQPADAGDYTVRALDANGNISLLSDPVTVTYTEPGEPGPFPTDFQKVELVTEIKNPVNFEFAPDGRVFILDRYGEILIYNPETQITVSAGAKQMFKGLEDGLLGIEFDPNFATNNKIYLFYSPWPRTENHNRVSRFTMNGNQIDWNSEELIIAIPTQRDQCCHSGGDLEFDSQGNLYIATGDNTNHSYYSTLNEQDPNESSENTSSNTNDLRGKILRIKPLASGGYSIPAGNLFPNGVGGLPEIYVMGARNPFRMFVDRENTDWLFWGEVGPDANQPGPEGPVGLDEINLTKAPGNYGWPYFAGKNEPYLNTYANPNFYYDPANPVNISVWNTGETDLPPAEPSWMEFFHECYLTGPRYYFDPTINDQKKLPAYFDEYYFYYDFNTSKLWASELDNQGNVLSTTQMNPAVFTGAGFIDVKIGPDGHMYILEYGAGCCPNNTGTGKLSRIDYNGLDTNSAPSVSISADKTSGSVPLTVNFSSAGTSDPDGDSLIYEWDFQTDGSIDSNEPNPTFIYNTAGNYSAQLRVKDGNGGISSKSISISAGNNAATFVFNHPPDGGIFNWDDHLNFDIDVMDPEDGSTTDGSISCADVSVVPSIGHLDHFHDALPINECSGTFPFTIEGHNTEGQMDIFYVLNFNYVDQDGLSSFDQITLHPKIKEAEFSDQQYNTQSIANTDPLGGGNLAIRAAQHNSYIVFEGRNLLNVDQVSYRVASANGGVIEMHTGSPTGPLVSTAMISSTGGTNQWETVTVALTDPGGKNDLYFVFKNEGSTNLFDLNYIQFEGAGISINDTPPKVNLVQATAADRVHVKFSEPIDLASAESASNYAIDNGITITSANVLSDGRTVALNTSSLTPEVSYLLTISNVANKNGVNITSPIERTFSYGAAQVPIVRINAGGPQLTLQNITWQQDQYSTGGKTYSNNVTDIQNTTSDDLYRTERYGNFSYEIPVPEAGLYDVNLHFAEIYFGVANNQGVGARIFNVDIESGEATLTNYDIIEKAGGPATAVVEQLTGIQVNDGFLTITLSTVKQNPKISAIEVFGNEGATPEPSVTILSPSDGAQVTQPFQLFYEIQNWDVGSGTTHFHLIVDGVSQGGIYNTDPITFDTLSIGTHTIELSLMHANHSPAGYSDQITVEVVEDINCGNTEFPAQWTREILVNNELPYRSVYIFAEDLNGDGLKDIVTGGWWFANPGSATGTWQQNVIGEPMNNMSLIFDIDKDGDLDIFGTQGQYISAEMAWAENDGSGNFTIHTNIPAGTSTYHETFMAGAVVGNFNAGAALQIAFTWNGGEHGNSDVQMLTIPADPVNQQWYIETISTQSFGESIVSGDIDKDGDLDLFQGLNWLRNDNGTWTEFSTGVSLPTNQERNALVDLNGDGILDGVMTQIGTGRDIYWLEGPQDPTQNWTLRTIGSGLDAAINLDVADIDFDGDMDVVTGEWKNQRRVLAYENDLCNTGTWIQHIIHPGGDGRDHHDGTQAVDIDNDGDLDIISIGWDNIRPMIVRNNTPLNNQSVPTSNASLAYTPDYTPELKASGSTKLSNARHHAMDESLKLMTVCGYPTYYWYKDNELIEVSNRSTIVLNDKLGGRFTPADSGRYSVVVEDKYGTRSKASNAISIIYLTSQKLGRVTSIESIAPNPFTERIRIRFADDSFRGEPILLYDMMGKVVKTKQISGIEEIIIDLNGLDPGVYLLQIKDEQYRLIKRD